MTALTALALAAGAGQAVAAPVVLISIDGMLPEYYLEPDKIGLRIPNLRTLVREGSFAIGASSVMPTVTFPAHTTMITGANPNRHGILMNEIFDPDGTLGGGWHFYYGDIKVPTLFDVARKAKLKTAAVTWPVTAGAPIDFNLPDMYPVPNLREAKNLVSLAGGSSGEAVLREVLPAAETLIHMGDDVRAKVAVRLVRERPDFLAVHFLDLDGIQHRKGPRAPEALAVLETIDGHLGQIFDALRADGRWAETTIVLVSDHGFAEVHQAVRVGVLLRALGLTDVDATGRVRTWRAIDWPGGGTTGIFLHPEATADDRRKVDDAVKLLLSNPVYGVAKAYRGPELAATGGFAGAYAVLEALPDFWFTRGAEGTPLLSPSTSGGMHGYNPSRPGLRAAFIIRGPSAKPNKKLGVVRLIDVAPTVARILGVDLGKVEGRVLTEALRP